MARQPGAVKELAARAGFDLAGVARAAPLGDARFFLEWAASGKAGEMRYLTDHRAVLRADPRSLLSSARSVICVGKLYNTATPYSAAVPDSRRGWISRYAWGEDYHGVLRHGLRRLAEWLGGNGSHEYRICVDTAPLLERSYARQAGLGWIGKNACLINQQRGSWFFLGCLLTSLEFDEDGPPPDRCGSCRRCIDACPTAAIVPGPGAPGPEWQLDARLCISYLTIELRDPMPEDLRAGVGNHVFGCDICQDVCPWNRRAPSDADPVFAPRLFHPPLEELASMTEQEFHCAFAGTPVMRARYRGFLRNVAVAMGNSGEARFGPALENLARHEDELVAEHARRALTAIEDQTRSGL